MSRLRLLAMLVSIGVASRGAATSDREMGFFASPEPLQILIQAPWSTLGRRLEAGRTIAGRLVHLAPTGEAIDIGITMSTRGKSRLKVCSKPLLALELAPQARLDTPFRDQPRLHLTTQCQRNDRSKDNLVQEYLSYEAYRLLSNHALGVRLTTIKYLDTEGERRKHVSYGFFVEDLDLAATRLAVEWLDLRTVRTSALEPESLAVLGLFQYMLGNTDWSARAAAGIGFCCHNVAIFGPPGAESDLFPVPYDLDCTGLVDPDYAAPATHLPIRQVRQRLYRGFCASNPYLPRAVERFNAVRTELYALFENNSHLTSYSKHSTRKYLDDFFEILDDPEKFENHVLDMCR